jgi:hypothetical protein
MVSVANARLPFTNFQFSTGLQFRARTQNRVSRNRLTRSSTGRPVTNSPPSSTSAIAPSATHGAAPFMAPGSRARARTHPHFVRLRLDHDSPSTGYSTGLGQRTLSDIGQHGGDQARAGVNATLLLDRCIWITIQGVRCIGQFGPCDWVTIQGAKVLVLSTFAGVVIATPSTDWSSGSRSARHSESWRGFARLAGGGIDGARAADRRPRGHAQLG